MPYENKATKTDAHLHPPDGARFATYFGQNRIRPALCGGAEQSGLVVLVHMRRSAADPRAAPYASGVSARVVRPTIFTSFTSFSRRGHCALAICGQWICIAGLTRHSTKIATCRVFHDGRCTVAASEDFASRALGRA